MYPYLQSSLKVRNLSPYSDYHLRRRLFLHVARGWLHENKLALDHFFMLQIFPKHLEKFQIEVPLYKTSLKWK